MQFWMQRLYVSTLPVSRKLFLVWDVKHRITTPTTARLMPGNVGEDAKPISVDFNGAVTSL